MEFERFAWRVSLIMTLDASRSACPSAAEVGAIGVVTILAVSGYKTFVTCPSLDQGAVNAEVLI